MNRSAKLAIAAAGGLVAAAAARRTLASRAAFKHLFRYISGGNERDEDVPMTAPVATDGTGESISMTTPVRTNEVAVTVEA